MTILTMVPISLAVSV